MSLKFAAVAAAAVVLAAVAYFAWRTDVRTDEVTESIPIAGDPGATSADASASASSLAVDDAELIEQLRARYAPYISDKHAQIKLIEQLIRYLSARYPDDWRARLPAMLRQLFPDLADDLLARFEKLEGHNRWLDENRHSLNRMSAAQRREALWAARYETFGADAEEIWAGARRGEQLQETLASLQNNPAPAAQKLEQFVDAIKGVYGEQAPQFLEMRQTELLGSFLAVASVQDELRALAPAQRRATLRALRETMGMDEAALTRWEELDRSRDLSWDAGQRYMAERAAVLAVGAPEQQAQQLKQLRERAFGAEEAAIIQSEEEAGFYRFAGERRIGRE